MKIKGWHKETRGGFALDLGEGVWAEIFFIDEDEAGVFLNIGEDSVKIGNNILSQTKDPTEREAEFQKQALNILFEHFNKPARLIQSLLTQP